MCYVCRSCTIILTLFTLLLLNVTNLHSFSVYDLWSTLVKIYSFQGDVHVVDWKFSCDHIPQFKTLTEAYSVFLNMYFVWTLFHLSETQVKKRRSLYELKQCVFWVTWILPSMVVQRVWRKLQGWAAATNPSRSNLAAKSASL